MTTVSSTCIANLKILLEGDIVAVIDRIRPRPKVGDLLRMTTLLLRLTLR